MINVLVIESYDEEGKYIENETGRELTVDEALETVCEYWNDMGSDYYSFNLKIENIELEELISECDE